MVMEENSAKRLILQVFQAAIDFLMYSPIKGPVLAGKGNQ